MLRGLGADQSRIAWIVGAALTLAWLTIYLLTVSPTVNFIDSGELITALYEPGIAHAPGYPLYVLMGYVVSHLLWGEVAWRVNAMSAFWAAMAVGMFYFLILEVVAYLRRNPVPRPPATPKSKKSRQLDTNQRNPQPGALAAAVDARPTWAHLLIAIGGASLLGASASFWSRAVQAKMYSLHYFFVGLTLLLALKFRQAYERHDQRAARRWLVVVVAVTALSFTNHLMTNLLVPGLAVMILWGQGWRARLRFVLRSWAWILPGLLPLLLYLYLPLRSAQQPYMNWGSPDNWGDFWRHVTGWQFRTYLFDDFDDHAPRVMEFIISQWSFLSWPMLLLGLGATYLVARASLPLFLATLATALATVAFSLAYPISEIEPYLVSLYAMLVLWIACAPVALVLISERAASSNSKDRRNADAGTLSRYTNGAGAALAGLALLLTSVQYPAQDRSRDYLAQQFATNVFRSLPENSILITDYWDFYAPTYYLQHVQGIRPDLAIIDMSLVKYPWYLGQLQKKYPWIVDNSKDVVSRFRVLQRRWVDGEVLTRQELQQLDSSYYELLDSFVTANRGQRPAYVLFLPTQESARVARGFVRQPFGLVDKLMGQQSDGVAPEIPDEPQFELRGITHDLVPFDEFARLNSKRYVDAYARLQQLYAQVNQPDKAQRMATRAQEVAAAIKGR